MEQAGLTKEDLVPCIGSRSMVSRVLARKQPLTVDMARALEATFGIAYDVLIQKEEDLESRVGAVHRRHRE